MVRTPLRLCLTALAASAILLVGCGTSSGDAADDPTTTAAEATTTAPADATPAEPTETTVAEAPAEDDDICISLKVLSDFDIESAGLINAGDWTETQAFFIENTDAVLGAYDDAIALDSEVTADLEALRAVTETTAETAADSSDLMDFSTKLLDQPGIMEAGAAGFRLNTFAEENCGFSTGGAGN